MGGVIVDDQMEREPVRDLVVERLKATAIPAQHDRVRIGVSRIQDIFELKRLFRLPQSLESRRQHARNPSFDYR